MLDILAEIDTLLFLLLNVTAANPFTDAVMPVVTSDGLLRALYAVAMVLLLWKGNARMRWLVLFSALVLMLTDQTASKFLKPLIDRPRPCHVLENIHLLVNCGGGRSMPSSHAANAFGQAALFGLAYPRIRWYLWLFAGVVAISRVFVGVHYPGDILAGAIIGILIGWLVMVLFRRVGEKYLPGLRAKKSSSDEGKDHGDSTASSEG